MVKDPTYKAKLALCIDGQTIGDWFKEQFEKIRQNIHPPVLPQRKGRGMKL